MRPKALYSDNTGNSGRAGVGVRWVDPVAALYYSAVIQRVVAVPLLVIIFLIGNNKQILGERTSGRLSNLAADHNSPSHGRCRSGPVLSKSLIFSCFVDGICKFVGVEMNRMPVSPVAIAMFSALSSMNNILSGEY